MNARNQEVSHSLYVFDSKPPVSKALPISLQHIIAMFLGTVTVPIVIAGAAGADAATRTIMIQYSLMMSALATMIQVCPLGPVGSRLPVIFCAGFTCVPVFTPIAAQYGLPGVFGAQLLCAVITIALGFCVGRLHKFFPTVVTGTIILSIGLSLYPIALKYMAGNASSPTYGQLNNWIVAFVTLAAVLFFNLMCKGVVKMASILLGAVVGAIALLRGDNFMPEWTVSYLGALLYLALFGSVIAFGAYFTLVGRIGASKAAYSTLLFPLVALSISTVYEGYVWHSSAVIGLALILLGNMVMFAKPEQLLLRRRLA